ncbi:MAG: hypothetical protein FJ257_12490 [Phycisphaerae bacterium]|nr:hypothetical protein [Phycisphaerae bacterium]
MTTAAAATILSITALLPQDAPPTNAAEIYRQAFAAWEALAAEDRETISNALGDPRTIVAAAPETTVALDRAGRAIDLFLQASQVEGCDWGLDRSKGFALLLPHLAPMRELSRAAALSAVRDLAGGRSDAAIASLEAVSRSTRHLSADPVLVDSLVGGAILGLSSSAIESAIELGAIDAASAARLEQALPKDVVDAIGVDAALHTEGEVFAEEIARIRAGDETLADDFVDQEIPGASATLQQADAEVLDAAMAKVRGFGERAIAAMADPDRAARSAALAAIDADVEALRASDPEVAGALLAFMPSHASLGRAITRIEDRVLATRTTLHAIAAGEDPARFVNGAIDYLRTIAFIEQTPPRLQVAIELLRQAPPAADESMRREVFAWLDRVDEAVLARLRRAGRAGRCDFDFGRGGEITPGDVLLRGAFASLRGGARLLLVEARRRCEQAAAIPETDEEARLEAATLRAGALGDLVAVADLARHLAGDATLGGTLVSASVLRELSASVAALRMEGLVGDEALDPLRSAIASLPRGDAVGPLGSEAARRRLEAVASRVASGERSVTSDAALLAVAIASDGPEDLPASADQPLWGAEDLIDLEAWSRLAALRERWGLEASEQLARVVRVGEVPIDESGEALAAPCRAQASPSAVEALAAVDEALQARK